MYKRQIITSSQEETIENNLKKCTLATGWDTIIYTNNNNVDSYCLLYTSVMVTDLRVLSKAQTPPFEIVDETSTNEELRL